MKLAKASEMQELDRCAIEQYRIPGTILMENAGRGTFSFMVDELGPVTGKSAVIFVGPGNNGGDGLVIARCIIQAGGYPLIVYLVPPDKLRGDAAHNQKIAEKSAPASLVVAKEEDIEVAYRDILKFMTGSPPWSIVDAIFGTGLQRPLEGKYLAAVRLVNTIRAEKSVPVTAVDIPSGLNSDTGQPLGGCVMADLTATYGLAKPGHFMHGGGPVGKLHVVDIGIPAEAVAKVGLRGETIDRTILKELKQRDQAAHKGHFGHLLVMAGSEGKTGAAMLSALGALRIGTGLVTLLAPGKLNPVFETSLLEAMTIPLPVSDGFFSIEDAGFITQQLPGKDAMVIGPGLGTDRKTAELVVRLYREVMVPMVVDADALNILVSASGVLQDPPAPRIFTPHPGEMARLAGKTAKIIQEDRLHTACAWAAKVNIPTPAITLILKGAGTIICDPEGTWAVNTTGNPGMATGGMGDVLSGIVAGLLAQGYVPAIASRIGVFLHGHAADRLARTRKFGYLASEVAAVIPELVAGSKQ